MEPVRPGARADSRVCPVGRNLRRRPDRRSAALTLAGAVLATLIAGLPAAADPADPGYPSAGEIQRSREQEQRTAQDVARIEAQLAAADSRLEQVGEQAARVVEAYNGAVYRLGRARAAAAQAERRYTEAADTAREAQVDVGRVAASSYRHGGDLALLGLVLEADGPKALLDRASFLEYVGSHKQGVLHRSELARTRAAALRAEADAALATRRSATDVLLRAKEQAEAGLAAQQRVHEAVQSERARLLAQLATVRRTTTALEQRRRAGIEAARQAEQARRTAAAAAAATRAAEARRAAADSGRVDGPGTAWQPGDASDGSDASGAGGPGGGQSRGTASRAERAIDYATAQLGKPYEWAADGPDSFDCSGLTMRAWQTGGVGLPHYSVAQYEQSAKISPPQLRRGDLVFFASDSNDHKTIYHVGLFIGDGQMIEAPYTGAPVRISSIYRSSLFGAARP